MRNNQSPSTFRLAAVAILLTASHSAYAYLDPGTGSILLQGILASVAVAIGVVRTYWYRIKSFFGGAAESDAVQAGEADVSTQDSTGGS